MEKGTNFKYIVYLTTNKVNNKIYIGVHKTLTPDKFDGYIGCGILINEPNTYSKPKTHFQYAVKKHGVSNFNRETLAIFDTAEEAYLLEKDLVNEKFLARNDVYNMCLGGFGSIGENNKIKVYKYSLNGNFIEEFPSITEAAAEYKVDHSAISHAIRRKEKSCDFYWNTDKVDKLDLSLYSVLNNHRVETHVYSIKGEYIESFNSCAQASKSLGITASAIGKSIKTGVRVKDLYFSSEKAYFFDNARSIQLAKREVFKYSSDGKFIQGYNTQKEAELDNPYSNISKSIKLKSICDNGFMWSIEKLKNYNVPNKACTAKRIVGKFDLEGNLVKKYESATEAEKENGTSVWKVLSGKNKTHKGHIYKYLDN